MCVSCVWHIGVHACIYVCVWELGWVFHYVPVVCLTRVYIRLRLDPWVNECVHFPLCGHGLSPWCIVFEYVCEPVDEFDIFVG